MATRRVRSLPTWLRVVLLASLAVLVVGAVALLALLVPPVGEAIRGAPVVVAVLVVGTVAVLALTVRASLRR